MSKSTETPFFVRWIQLEYIPDVLRNNDLLAQELPARIDEVLGNWAKALSLLASWEDQCTVALRFWATSGSEQLKVFVGFRFENDDANRRGSNTFELFLSNLLASAGIRTEGAESNKPNAKILFPQINERDAVFHISQSLKSRFWEIARTDEQLAAQNMRWTFRPFTRPSGSFAEAFRNLFNLTLGQPSSSFLSSISSFASYTVYLRPVELRQQERQWIWNQMQLTNKQSQEILYHQNEPSGTSVDRMLTSTSDSFRNFLANLEPAFTCFSEVVVRDDNPQIAASTGSFLARAFAAEINESQKPNNMSSGESEQLRSQCQILEPSSAFADRPRLIEQINQVSRQTFNELRIRHWIGQAIRLDEEAVRIPYLVNPSGAAVLFRLPIDTGKGLPGIPVRQSPPDFDPGDARVVDAEEYDYTAELSTKHQGQPDYTIALGDLHSGGDIRVKASDLTRHTLIVGNTGSGKTVTTMHLLGQLRVPFLVLETAKKEYRRLLGITAFQGNVQVFTPGSEGVVPLRINPFELLPGVRVEYHVGALQTCFEAALPLQGPLFAILEEALVNVYRTLGWRMDEARPAGHLRSKPFPTMNLFAMTLRDVAEKRGYAGEFKNNITAAISGRINPLTIGSGTSKGKLLDCNESYPPLSELFTKPTVLELNDLRSEEKALVTMLLLVFLREHREMEQQSAPSDGLRHLVVIEEAHNVLAAPQNKGGEDAPDTRNAAIERFSNMLTEMRSLGQGILIADQSPHKILPDALRNTNLQIVHQLRAEDDREAVASSMVMSQEQVNFVAKMRPGQAAVFYTGLERATFVQIPKPRVSEEEEKRIKSFSHDDKLRGRMQEIQPGNGLLWDHARRWPHRGCLQCAVKSSCKPKPFGKQIATSLCNGGKDPYELLFGLPKVDTAHARLVAWNELVKDQERAENISPERGLFWCSLIHLMAKSLEANDAVRMQRLKLELESINFLNLFLDWQKSATK